MTSAQEQIQWLRHPQAETFIVRRLDQLVADMPPLQDLQARLALHTNTRLVDWLDHLILADGDAPRGQLADWGFELAGVLAESGDTVYHHPGTVFCRLVLRGGSSAGPGTAIGAAIAVEQIAHFLAAQRVAVPIEGPALSPVEGPALSLVEGTPWGSYRRARVWQVKGRELLVVERRGHAGFVPLDMAPDYAQRYLHAFERWSTRPRHYNDAREGLTQTLALAQALVSDMGTDTAAWIAFEAERLYWQQRNRAGQVQKSRQDALGLGWANHDHHTFRSSREVFKLLIQILETFGFRPRERFYAGAEAGWGAQVMEQPACRLAVFADVDLSPDEVEGDFAHEPLPPRRELGTIGLWCALHGESVLAAGLHHLACRLDFAAAVEALERWNVKTMQPFSEFSFLQQAFTRGERWAVSPERLERLAASGQIDARQRERFAQEGAVASHLENIQRGEGFKGFNQQTVSDIIRRTDPRVRVKGDVD
ncbi:MAG: hypothetical protein PVF45_04420 [Anaerolineae bacterium]|jgi:hypothetical protein